jgi:sec-independent protein translocase protein TatA
MPDPLHPVTDALPRLLAIGIPGGWEWIILLVLGLLIFGRRLPEVGRSLGRGIVEFKRGIKGIEDEVEEESSKPDRPRVTDDRRSELPSQSASKTAAREKREEVVDGNAGDE